MKNILVILLAFAALSLNAQDVQKNGKFKDSYGFFRAAVSDSITDNQDTLEITFLMQPDQSVLWHADVHIDTTVTFPANDSIKVEPFGKVFASDSWASVGTAQYFDGNEGGSLSFSETSTADFIRYLMVRITYIGGAGTGKATLYNANSGKEIELKGWF